MEQHHHRPEIDGRIRRSKQQAMNCLKEQQQSGQSVKDYCQANGMSEKTFYRWAKKFGDPKPGKRKKQGRTQGGFASIEVIGNAVNSGPQLFAEVGNIKFYREVSAEYLKKLLA
jgi:predicted DNA-binding transcriptional regulator AlpA